MPVSSTLAFQRSFPATSSTRSGAIVQAKGQASVMAIASTTGTAAKTGTAGFMPIATELALPESLRKRRFLEFFTHLTSNGSIILYSYC